MRASNSLVTCSTPNPNAENIYDVFRCTFVSILVIRTFARARARAGMSERLILTNLYQVSQRKASSAPVTCYPERCSFSFLVFPYQMKECMILSASPPMSRPHVGLSNEKTAEHNDDNSFDSTKQASRAITLG